ncbi:hypothetical protein Syn7502_02576 [Synechococcus sp. PCC 7502]|uniref:endolytic transglycosylase MltG n=1 Tax=Synechococcus sp. PCC 7502 TaxID=1173263 RepID=UPI00029FAC23|nr:endolytic transglycosylase MltG [Synechococcus sp. PCC 7502]AFY74539.1 hypothetical protein Syn7502_02576 [Synechococcus sp. PCC 7502]
MTKKTNLLLVIALVITSSGLWWLWAIASPNPELNLEVNKIKLIINKGEPTQEIASKLETAGVIRSGLALRIWLKYLEIKGDRTALRAGIYKFSPSHSLFEVLDQIQTQIPEEVVFTIPEGWTIAQMATYFEQKGFFPARDFIKATKTNLKQRPWLPSKISSLEGFLFPDTYQIHGQATPDQIIAMMLSRFEEVALPLIHTKSGSINLKDWVTFASIVEKEAVLDQERSIIAGVFQSRLKLGMRLESDPTVEYGLNIKQTPDQPLTFKQVRTPSPYNTYLNKGLPPGAIAAPGLKSLEAALNPQVHGYLFFVARYDGSHIFSRTFAEHQVAIQAVAQELEQKAKNSDKNSSKN